MYYIAPFVTLGVVFLCISFTLFFTVSNADLVSMAAANYRRRFSVRAVARPSVGTFGEDLRGPAVDALS